MLELSGIDVAEIGARVEQPSVLVVRLIGERGGAGALQGRGPFRRFKIELYEHLPALISPWHAVRDVRAHHRAVDWLLDHGLINQNAADKFTDDHPEPGLP